MQQNELIPHLFRNEYSKLVAVLTKRFGLEHIETAQDIASETFLQALDTWPYRGVPQNPAAWLYTVAKNKTKNHLARNASFRKAAKDIAGSIVNVEEIDIDFSETNIADSQLRMLFTICHPSISQETQISLALRILCGFGLNEIADALLSSREAVHKRLQRGRRKLQEQVRLDMPGEAVSNERLDTILKTIYLLFSEGYYSESNDNIIRTALCVDALNLGYLILRNPSTNTHAGNALMSLMCFQASRLEARKTANGDLILYDEQDRRLWDTELIEKGFHYLQQASKWEITSSYYLEASIAYWHTVDNSNPDKWGCILMLYDALLQTNASPVVKLNRVWAYSRVYGNAAAIVAMEELRFKSNHFYFVLLAELYKESDPPMAVECLEEAIRVCKTSTEKQAIIKQMEVIKIDYMPDVSHRE